MTEAEWVELAAEVRREYDGKVASFGDDEARKYGAKSVLVAAVVAIASAAGRHGCDGEAILQAARIRKGGAG